MNFNRRDAQSMTFKTLVVDGMVIHVKRSKRRSLQLEVGVGGVLARAPLRMSETNICDFVRQKRHWLNKHLANQPKEYLPLSLISGSAIPYLGQEIQLVIDQNSSGPMVLSSLNKTPYLRLTAARCQREITDFVRDKLVRWYRQKAEDEFTDLAAQLSSAMGLAAPKSVRVRDYKRRWGSCDAKGQLSFNWRLIMAPQPVIRYVVVHELAHRYEFNHSTRFWHIVERHQADWQEQRDWLYRYGLSLYRL